MIYSPSRSRIIGGRSNQRPTGKGWSPLSIAGCAVWLRAEGESYSNGASVPTWRNRVNPSIAVNATQATGARQPVFTTGIINGKSVMRFSGGDGVTTGHYMQVSPFTATSTATLVIVAQKRSSFYAYSRFAEIGGNSNACIAADGSDAAFAFQGGNTLVGIASANNVFHIALLRMFLPSYEAWLDGGSLVTQPTVSVVTGATQLNLNTFGGGVGAYTGNNDLAEVIVYDNAISDSNKDTLTAHLKSFYAIP